MYVEFDISDIVIKIELLVRKELINFFGSIGLDISSYVDKMYSINVTSEGIDVEVNLPYFEIIEYGSVGFEEFSKNEIIEWFVKNISNDVNEAEKFAELYISLLESSDGIFLEHKINRLLEIELGD